MASFSHCVFVLLLAVAPVACSEQAEQSQPNRFSREELLDPETCRECHPTHYLQWAGSMHAYASLDPVFLAMNRRGQEETDGELGSFCVSCHAPLALREGATSDGLDLEEVPKKLQGVTCYFCHNVEDVEGDHNNPLRLANDATMRGGIRDPVPNTAHASEYSELMATPSLKSAKLCGSCHDVKLPSPPAPEPLHLERTFSEWKGSIFSPPRAVSESAALSCNACHMPFTPGTTITDGSDSPPRSLHMHAFAGVDVALSPFPRTGDSELDERSNEVQQAELRRLLDTTLRLEICVFKRLTGGASITVIVDNASAGHNFPSGASQDRRAFMEVRAFAAGEEQPFYESGVLAEGQAVAGLDDPDLWLLRDRLFDAEGEEVHQFWEAAEVQQETLPVATSLDPLSPGFLAGHAQRKYPRQGRLTQVPERVTLRVLLVPIGRDVLADLVDSGHLEAAVAQAMPTHVLLPNRHLATSEGAAPELATLGSVSFEWGAATRQHGDFRRSIQNTQLGEEECIGMPGRPLPDPR